MPRREKPVVLTFVGHYLPGYKAGGLVRTVVNTVDHMCDEFEFRIVTRDRDFGDSEAYSGIRVDEWQRVGNAWVYYLGPHSAALARVRRLLSENPHQALWLNSFFDPLTVKALFNIRLGRVVTGPVAVAPRGEFAWASLGQKYPKKLLFMWAARLFGLYRGVTWHASGTGEAQDIANVMKIRREDIRVTDDFPIKDVASELAGADAGNGHAAGPLRLVFLSRIAREKNLDYALKVLGGVKTDVIFDIHGPVSDEAYWVECRQMITRLPANVKVEYHGSVSPGEVVNTFQRYDLFLFPTGGEAYGHVIAECLIAGTPVLVSTETPWRNLEADGLGWDLDLARQSDFVEVIEKLAASAVPERKKARAAIKTKVVERLLDPAVVEAHRRLFGASATGAGDAPIPARGP